MNKSDIRHIISGISAVICMILIFLFSSDNAEESNEKSGFFVELLMNLPGTFGDNLSFIVRKTAHFTIYAVLGFLVSGIFRERKNFYALSVCFLYACTDEIHQYFVPGRACRFTDVIIDTAGAFCGIIIFALLCRIFGNRKNTDNI